MNRVYYALVVPAAPGLRFASHGQAQSTAARAAVRAELIAGQQSGHYPQSDTSYPAPANGSPATPHVFRRSRDVIATSYGPSTSGSADAGFRTTRARSLANASAGFDDIYRGQ